jgi:hypothetical protein
MKELTFLLATILHPKKETIHYELKEEASNDGFD